MKKEIIFDLILKKFEGDRSFSWESIHEKEFYESINKDYFVVENHLNFLIGENLIKESEGNPICLSLTRKGWFIMTNDKSDGYKAKATKERREIKLRYILAILSFATFSLVSYRFYVDIIKNKSQMKITTQSESSNQTEKRDTAKLINIDLQVLQDSFKIKNKK